MYNGNLSNKIANIQQVSTLMSLLLLKGSIFYLKLFLNNYNYILKIITTKTKIYKFHSIFIYTRNNDIYITSKIIFLFYLGKYGF